MQLGAGLVQVAVDLLIGANGCGKQLLPQIAYGLQHRPAEGGGIKGIHQVIQRLQVINELLQASLFLLPGGDGLLQLQRLYGCPDLFVQVGLEGLIGGGGVHRLQHRLQIGKQPVGIVEHRQQVKISLIGGGQPGIDELNRAPCRSPGIGKGGLSIGDGHIGGRKQAVSAVHHRLQRKQHLL